MNEEASIDVSHLIESRKEWAESVREEGRDWALEADYADLRAVAKLTSEAIEDERPESTIIDDHSGREMDVEERELFQEGARDVFNAVERQM